MSKTWVPVNMKWASAPEMQSEVFDACDRMNKFITSEVNARFPLRVDRSEALAAQFHMLDEAEDNEPLLSLSLLNEEAKVSIGLKWGAASFVYQLAEHRLGRLEEQAWIDSSPEIKAMGDRVQSLIDARDKQMFYHHPACVPGTIIRVRGRDGDTRIVLIGDVSVDGSSQGEPGCDGMYDYDLVVAYCDMREYIYGEVSG